MENNSKKKYLLDNIEKYVIDSRGNFFHIDPDMLNDEKYYIGRDTFNYEELREAENKWVKKVIENKEDWEVLYDIGNRFIIPKGIKNKRTGYELLINRLKLELTLGSDNCDLLIRELGGRVKNRSEEFVNGLREELCRIYQKGKKYSQHEFRKLLYFVNTILYYQEELGFVLDNNFLDAKNELQTIEKKTKPLQTVILPMVSRAIIWTGKVEVQLGGISKDELEKCKKALEDTQEVLYLSSPQDCLLEKVNEKLKELDLEAETGQLKNQNSGTQIPEQQAKNQKKVEEKERKLTEIKEDKGKKQKSINKEITVFKTQITQTLKKHNLKTTDLPKKYHNWEEQLSKLTTKEKIDSLVEEVNKEVENKLKELKQNQKDNNNKQPSPQSLSLSTKLLMGGGVVILITVFAFLISKRVKKRRK